MSTLQSSTKHQPRGARGATPKKSSLSWVVVVVETSMVPLRSDQRLRSVGSKWPGKVLPKPRNGWNLSFSKNSSSIQSCISTSQLIWGADWQNTISATGKMHISTRSFDVLLNSQNSMAWCTWTCTCIACIDKVKFYTQMLQAIDYLRLSWRQWYATLLWLPSHTANWLSIWKQSRSVQVAPPGSHFVAHEFNNAINRF